MTRKRKNDEQCGAAATRPGGASPLPRSLLCRQSLHDGCLFRSLSAVAGLLVLATFGLSARAQGTPSPQTSALLQPSLSELRSTVTGLHIAKWKAPGPVKEEALGNAGSIDRDLGGTLPALVAQADVAPQSVANAFAVYRNLDALYEVLLRVSGTAELAAPDVEAANLAHSLLTLDAARRSLADSILSMSHAQETALQQPRPLPPQPAAAAPAATSVVNDGPVAAPAHRKPKPKPKTTPAPTPQT